MLMDDTSVTKKLLHLPITVSNSDGVRQILDFAELQKVIQSNKLSWIDIADVEDGEMTAVLTALGTDTTDSSWIQHFGQPGRMSVGREKIRAVTWIADRHAQAFGPLIELHFFASKNLIITAWKGDPSCLSEIRHLYFERSEVLEKNAHHAASVVLQLLFSTLDIAMAELDRRIQTLQYQVNHEAASLDLALITLRMQTIQSVWSDIDRYSSSVRGAIVGIEALPNMLDVAAEEMNDYATQVEDIEHRLQDRSRWLSSIMQDYGTSLAAKQGEQINRLTIVSTIFLPLTWLTGFFGMNFDWLDQHLSGTSAFFVLGLGLPIASVCATIFWFRRRRLL